MGNSSGKSQTDPLRAGLLPGDLLLGALPRDDGPQPQRARLKAPGPARAGHRAGLKPIRGAAGLDRHTQDMVRRRLDRFAASDQRRAVVVSLVSGKQIAYDPHTDEFSVPKGSVAAGLVDLVDATPGLDWELARGPGDEIQMVVVKA